MTLARALTGPLDSFHISEKDSQPVLALWNGCQPLPAFGRISQQLPVLQNGLLTPAVPPGGPLDHFRPARRDSLPLPALQRVS